MRSGLPRQDQPKTGVAGDENTDARVDVAAEAMADAVVKMERSEVGDLPTDLPITRITGGQAWQPMVKIEGVE